MIVGCLYVNVDENLTELQLLFYSSFSSKRLICFSCHQRFIFVVSIRSSVVYNQADGKSSTSRKVGIIEPSSWARALRTRSILEPIVLLLGLYIVFFEDV